MGFAIYLLQLAMEVAKWSATKIFLTAMLMIGLPFVLKGVINWFFDQIIAFVLAFLPSLSSNLTAYHISLSGIASYIFEQTYSATCLSIILSAVATRLVLNFVPFVK